MGYEHQHQRITQGNGLHKCRFKQVLLYNENAFFPKKSFSTFWTNLIFSNDAGKLNSHLAE